MHIYPRTSPPIRLPMLKPFVYLQKYCIGLVHCVMRFMSNVLHPPAGSDEIHALRPTVIGSLIWNSTPLSPMCTYVPTSSSCIGVLYGTLAEFGICRWICSCAKGIDNDCIQLLYTYLDRPIRQSVELALRRKQKIIQPHASTPK